MTKTNRLVLIFVTCFVSTTLSANTPVVASYYAASGKPELVKQLPAEKLTHVLFAFLAVCSGNEKRDENDHANIQTQKAIKLACENKPPYSAVIYNEQQYAKELIAFAELKQKHPHLKLLPSVGGWLLSQPFHSMVKSTESKNQFVKSMLNILHKYPVFDGIDIDWEYPGGGGASQIKLKGDVALNEKKMFTLLMHDLRQGLDSLSTTTQKTYLLSAAVSGAKDKVNAIDWKNSAPYMDLVFVMTYDFAVGDGRAGHHTNLFTNNNLHPQNLGLQLSVKSMITNLLASDVPANKLVVGVAFYARGWIHSGWSSEHFAHQNKAISTGSYQYKDLVSKPPDGYIAGYDNKAQAAFLYNAVDDGFISFDNPRSIQAKAQFVKENDLAGLFSWQIMQDNGELLDAMHKHMQKSQKP